jgi:uncharacterized membrane protein YecN with MAPEG domain
MPQFTLMYAGCASLLYLLFSVLVIRCRLRTKTVIGDGGDALMLRHCRAHANFAEYVPLLLFLLTLLEMANISIYIIHAMGVAMLLGRVLHFYSLTVREVKTQEAGKMDIRFRQIGMVLTFSCLFFGGIMAILRGLAIL